MKEKVKKLFKEIGIEGSIEEVRKVGARRKDRRNMMVVKLGSQEVKRNIMEKRRN